jgi:hypothetical protein
MVWNSLLPDIWRCFRVCFRFRNRFGFSESSDNFISLLRV